MMHSNHVHAGEESEIKRRASVCWISRAHNTPSFHTRAHGTPVFKPGPMAHPVFKPGWRPCQHLPKYTLFRHSQSKY